MEESNNAFLDRFMTFLEKAFTTPSNSGPEKKDDKEIPGAGK